MAIPVYSRKYDVIVVGMGPAGAETAFELSRKGFSVLAFDKQVHPRYKICGGGLSLALPEFCLQIFPLWWKKRCIGCNLPMEVRTPL